MEATHLHIIPFRQDLAVHFKELNLHWVRQYFSVEPMDELILSNPKENILNKGGHVFFAEWDKEIAGTFALLKVEEGVYELSKMAVDEKFQGKKIGNKMLEAAIENAKVLGAHKLILFSNTILQPAIHLYKKYGFAEVPLGNSEYKRSNIKMELCLTPGPSPAKLESGEISFAEEPYPKYGVGSKLQYEYAKSNRKQSTEAETKLWEQLRDSKLGVKFRRQHPIESFIVDFVCLQKGIIVEVDGAYHSKEEQQQYDEQRTELLQQKGFLILRFTNEEVLSNGYVVRDKIKQVVTT